MLGSLRVTMPEAAQGRAPQPKPLEAEMGRIFWGGNAHEEKPWLPLGQALWRKGQLSPAVPRCWWEGGFWQHCRTGVLAAVFPPLLRGAPVTPSEATECHC